MDSHLKGSEAYTYTKPLGGYFFYLYLNDNFNIDKFNALLSENSIGVFYGIIFVTAKERERFKFLERQIRISFAYLDDDKIEEGIKLLRQCLDASIE